MIRSMTGFGKASRTLNGVKASVEVRSLNSKQLDLATKMPAILSELESNMRPVIIEHLIRGKVFVQCSLERTEGAEYRAINQDLAMIYHKELSELAGRMGEPAGNLLPVIVRMPDVTRPTDEALPQEQVGLFMDVLGEALDECNGFRVKEGLSLATDMKERITIILDLLKQIQPFEGARIDRIKRRIQDELLRNFRDEDIDRSRFEQELIFYLEKLDINEEKVRLKGHCQHFLDVMETDGTAGKKLNFISQEMGREINTIGSKANDLDIQKLVVSMKDELERIKEQTLNIL